MKTKELKNSLGVFGYYLFENDKPKFHTVMNNQGVVAAEIHNERQYEVDFCVDFETLSDAEYVYDLIVKYARTPIDEREDEEKFIYRFPYIVDGVDRGKEKYVCRSVGRIGVLLTHESKDYIHKTRKFHFTDNQVQNLSVKAKALIELCEKERVK